MVAFGILADMVGIPLVGQVGSGYHNNYCEVVPHLVCPMDNYACPDILGIDSQDFVDNLVFSVACRGCTVNIVL